MGLAAGVLALGLGLGAATRAQSVTVEGQPGDVRVTSDAPLSVRTETADGQLIFTVSCTKVAKASPGLEGLLHPVPGGVQVAAPLAAKPTLHWAVDGATLRWSMGTAEGAGGVFDSVTPPSYPLGPGDKLQISVFGVDNMNETVVVDSDGTITFPVLDRVPVNNLTVPQLQHKMGELLAQYVKDPQVSIQLIEYGSRYVNVLGAVQTPGRIPLKGAFRVLDAITQAGGFLEKSGDVEIQRRDAAGKLESRVFSKEDLLSGSEKANIYVLDQDVINVQPAKQIYVTGEVKSPGAIPYTKDMTLLRAITMAGGFTQWAKKDPVDILRQDAKATKVLHVDVGRIEKGKEADVPLMPNDQVVVKERKFF